MGSGVLAPEVVGHQEFQFFIPFMIRKRTPSPEFMSSFHLHFEHDFVMSRAVYKVRNRLS